MINLRKQSSNHKREVFLGRKRNLHVREIIDQLGDNKHNATPQLIMEALNKNGDNVCLEDASNILHLVLRKAAVQNHHTRLRTRYHWQINRLRRLKYVVWKLGGVERAKPDEILEAMRINDENDYYLTVGDVKYNLDVNRKYLDQTGSCFKGAGHSLESMWPAPLVDDGDSLSQKMETKLFLGDNKNEKISSDQLGGSGGPMRRALRGGDRNNSNSCYKKSIDYVVTDFRSLTIDPN